MLLLISSMKHFWKYIHLPQYPFNSERESIYVLVKYLFISSSLCIYFYFILFKTRFKYKTSQKIHKNPKNNKKHKIIKILKKEKGASKKPTHIHILSPLIEYWLIRYNILLLISPNAVLHISGLVVTIILYYPE